MGGKAACVWAAGPRSMERAMAVKSLAKGWYKAMSGETWTSFWPRDKGWEATFLEKIEGKEYETWDVALAATDGLEVWIAQGFKWARG